MTKRGRAAGWWVEVLMVAGFAAMTALLALPAVLDLDLWVRNLVDAHRPPVADTIAQWVNRLGSGGALAAITLVIAGVLAWRRRTLWPLAPVVATFVGIALVVLPLKYLFHRAAPHSDLPDDVEVQLFSQPGFGLSYPSGHAVNTIVWYGVIVLLLAGWFAAHPAWRRTLRIAPPIIVGFTATYLGWHWLTDMVAGLFLGVLIDRLIRRVPWPGLPDVRP